MTEHLSCRSLTVRGRAACHPLSFTLLLAGRRCGREASCFRLAARARCQTCSKRRARAELQRRDCAKFAAYSAQYTALVERCSGLRSMNMCNVPRLKYSEAERSGARSCGLEAVSLHRSCHSRKATLSATMGHRSCLQNAWVDSYRACGQTFCPQFRSNYP